MPRGVYVHKRKQRITPQDLLGEKVVYYDENSRMWKVERLCEACKRPFFASTDVGKTERWIARFCSRKCINSPREGKRGWPKGRPRDEETKEKIGVTLTGTKWSRPHPLRGVPRTPEYKEQLRALMRLQDKAFKNNPDARSGYRYWDWTDAVKTRDNFTCQHCKTYSLKHLHAHHIKDWDNFPELRFDVNNGITLCRGCHRKEENRLLKLRFYEALVLAEKVAAESNSDESKRLLQLLKMIYNSNSGQLVFLKKGQGLG